MCESTTYLSKRDVPSFVRVAKKARVDIFGRSIHPRAREKPEIRPEKFHTDDVALQISVWLVVICAWNFKPDNIVHVTNYSKVFLFTPWICLHLRENRKKAKQVEDDPSQEIHEENEMEEGREDEQGNKAVLRKICLHVLCVCC